MGVSAAAPKSLQDLIQIEDPAFYAGDPFPVLARLRREAPVFHYEPLNVWVLSRYDDIRYVSRRPDIFSNSRGNNLNDVRFGGVSAAFFGADNIGATDPPRHRELRRAIGPGFSPRRMSAMEDRIRAFTAELLDALEPDVPLDFVDRVAAPLPLLTIAAVIGLPATSLDDLRYWSDETLMLGAALDAAGLARAHEASRPLNAFLNEWIVRKLGEDGEDLIATLITARRLGGGTVDYDTMHMFLRAVLVAGKETTRDLIAGSMHLFARHHEQRDALLAEPALVPRAVEECLRFTTPVRGFVRYVLEDTEIRGQRIAAGDFVQLLWTAANRDEEVWADPDRFDITRELDPKHLAFGVGEHACVGAALARLEARVFLEELIDRFAGWDLAGPPVRPHSTLHNSLEQLPLILRAK